EQATQVEAIMQNERARMDAIRQETAANLQSVMTAEQFARYQEMHQRRGRGGPGGPEGRKGMRDQWQSRQQQN
ncbi:MAG: hypothetical protein KDI15_12185, partial [Thiothrix sp.]|nr:hypothetical protein [Thiothrix sp.]